MSSGKQESELQLKGKRCQAAGKVPLRLGRETENMKII